MLSKSATKEIKKYSGIPETVKKVDKKPEKVKDTQVRSNETKKEPEDPRITREQVIAAFKSFGFTPNERNNEIGYWTTRGQSEGNKLMEELYKRRNDLNSEEDEVNKSKKTLPRLNDEEISSLFDEYGLPKPDPEWARNHLPNDPLKLRSLLEMQRKMTDDALKNEASALNAPPAAPQAAPMPIQAPTGMGGPLPPEGAEMMPTPTAKPFFIGDHSIVRITNPNNPNSSTTWLVDSKKKVLRPFMSEEAFKNAFENPAEAEKSVVTISSQELGQGGVLEGFTPLQSGKGVQEDGSMDDIEFSEATIQKNYGKPVNENDDVKSIQALDGLFGMLKKQ